MKQKIIRLAISLAVPLLVGFASAQATDNGAVYAQLNHPPLSPPGIVFPIVWTILYLLMGISCFLVWQTAAEQEIPHGVWLPPYALQLVLNFFWSILFFGMRMYLLGALWILLLIAAIVWMIVVFYKIRPIAAYLQIPYLLWCCFAAYLSFGIYFLN